MIKNRQKKTEEIIYTIENRIHEINKRYRKGPDLYFYKIEYFYGNTNESENKFFETTEFSFDLIKSYWMIMFD